MAQLVDALAAALASETTTSPPPPPTERPPVGRLLPPLAARELGAGQGHYAVVEAPELPETQVDERDRRHEDHDVRDHPAWSQQHPEAPAPRHRAQKMIRSSAMLRKSRNR